MKLHVANTSDQQIGGGYTFHRNFLKGMAEKYPEVEMVGSDTDADILFAFSASTVSGEAIKRTVTDGRMFVLRVDGVPEDSRNGGKGTRRLIEYAQAAHMIIYQSAFSYYTVGKILEENGVTRRKVIIPNGVDVDIFTPAGNKIAFPGSPKILHCAYRKDNNKRYEEVLAMYREYWINNHGANLVLLGRYPTEWQDYNMGFFNGERHQRLGVQADDAMRAQIMRSCDLMFYPSYADPAPNTVLEALACGVPILYQAYGGPYEVIGDAEGHIPPMAGNFIRGDRTYKEQIDRILLDRDELSRAARNQAIEHSIGAMVIKYKTAFDLLMGSPS